MRKWRYWLVKHNIWKLMCRNLYGRRLFSIPFLPSNDRLASFCKSWISKSIGTHPLIINNNESLKFTFINLFNVMCIEQLQAISYKSNTKTPSKLLHFIQYDYLIQFYTCKGTCMNNLLVTWKIYYKNIWGYKQTQSDPANM